MNALRTIAFSLVFYTFTVLLLLFIPLAALLGSNPLRAYTNSWAALMRVLTKSIVGIDTRIIGTVPDGPVLVAAKHESMYEAVELTRMLNSPATVMKRELGDLPVWGWAARRYGAIIVDRTANAAALRAMMKEGKRAKGENRSILIFPEGTRVAIGESPKLQAGFAGLYRILDLPVVPVAVRSAHVWPRKGFMRPGIVTLQFGEPIPPGLPRAEVEARVHAAINKLN